MNVAASADAFDAIIIGTGQAGPALAGRLTGGWRSGVSREWGYDDTEGTVGRVDSRPGERGCDGCCG
jgi:hypothetical protein